ncbi:hypothetical protein ACHWQZ_G008270 [Mnemiopsis leidyi]
MWLSWYRESLAPDNHDALRLKEARLPKITGSSPQLHKRRYLVDWVATICERCDITSETLHLAITCLDHFMDKYSIEDTQLHLIALCCLLIAAKFEECDVKIPRIQTLNYFVQNAFLTNEFRQMELLLLEFFCWNLVLPTSAHYIEYYKMAALSLDDNLNGEKVTVHMEAKIMKYIAKYCKYFLDISLQDFAFSQLPPSLVAAAAIASSRHSLGLIPSWTPQLREVTGFNVSQVQPVALALISVYYHYRARDAESENVEAPSDMMSKIQTSSDGPEQSVLA